MGLFSNLMGYSEMTLASSGATAGKPLGSNAGVRSTDRVKRELLEEDYRFDPVIFSTINTTLQTILSAGFTIKAKTARWQKKYDDFFENIGIVGEQTTIEELVEYIIQDMLMYGNSFVELVYDAKTDSKIVDLHMIPEKKMDYAKNASGEIVVDRYGRPVGYVMTLAWGHKGQGDEVPIAYKNKVSIQGNQIFFLPRRIAHFKLRTYGDRFYGIGLIEPAHTSSYRKRLIEEARANEIYTRGANTIIATVGDENHEAGPQELEDVLDQVSNFKHDRYFAFPKWVQIDTLPIDQNNAVDDYIKHLTINQVTSAGIPLSLATGNGEATNRSTLAIQLQSLEVGLESIVGKFSSAFNKYIIKPIAEANGIPEVAKIVFGDLIKEEKNDKHKRLMENLNAGVINVAEVRKYVIEAEDLDEDPGYVIYEKPDQDDMPKEELSQLKLGQKTVELGGYYMPTVNKDADPTKMGDKVLIEYHDNLHALWNKLSEGFQIGWSFGEIAMLHQKILLEFSVRNLQHVAPINDLDKVDMRF